MFHFDRWWNPSVERQAEDRSHRLGQESKVQVYIYTTEGTIEEWIEAILHEKQMLFDNLVDNVSIDIRSLLTAKDLFGLFGLTPPGPAVGEVAADADFGGMTGEGFEAFLEDALGRQGWSVATTPRARDGGIDLIARKVVDPGGEVTLFIQCKNLAHAVGVEVVRQTNGILPTLQAGVRAVVASPSGFTADARTFARERGVLLWDRDTLLQIHGTVRYEQK